MRDLLENIDDLHIALTQGNMHIVNIILAFIMFGVALGIKASSFKDIVRNPKPALVGVFMQWVALPAATFLVTIILNPIITPMVAIGMILVASCPGGNISNFMSSLARGNVELSVSMTAITTAFAPIITPFNFWLWGSLYTKYAAVHNDLPELEIPFGEMLHSIVIILGIPIVLGMLCSHYLPKLAERLERPIQRLSVLMFIGMVAISLSQVVRALEPKWEIAAGILCVLAVVIIHNATALTTGYLGARFAHLRKENKRTIIIETGIQNSGLGLALLLNPHIFPADQWASNGGMVLITALWGVWHIVSGLLIARYMRKQPL